MAATDSSKDKDHDLSAFYVETSAYALHNEIENSFANFFDGHRAMESERLHTFEPKQSAIFSTPGLTAAYNETTARAEAVLSVADNKPAAGFKAVVPAAKS